MNTGFIAELICCFGCKFESMNPPIFQWDIQRLIDQTMPIQQILPAKAAEITTTLR